MGDKELSSRGDARLARPTRLFAGDNHGVKEASVGSLYEASTAVKTSPTPVAGVKSDVSGALANIKYVKRGGGHRFRS